MTDYRSLIDFQHAHPGSNCSFYAVIDEVMERNEDRVLVKVWDDTNTELVVEFCGELIQLFKRGDVIRVLGMTREDRTDTDVRVAGYGRLDGSFKCLVYRKIGDQHKVVGASPSMDAHEEHYFDKVKSLHVAWLEFSNSLNSIQKHSDIDRLVARDRAAQRKFKSFILISRSIEVLSPYVYTNCVLQVIEAYHELIPSPHVVMRCWDTTDLPRITPPLRAHLRSQDIADRVVIKPDESIVRAAHGRTVDVFCYDYDGHCSGQTLQSGDWVLFINIKPYVAKNKADTTLTMHDGGQNFNRSIVRLASNELLSIPTDVEHRQTPTNSDLPDNIRRRLDSAREQINSAREAIEQEKQLLNEDPQSEVTVSTDIPVPAATNQARPSLESTTVDVPPPSPRERKIVPVMSRPKPSVPASVSNGFAGNHQVNLPLIPLVFGADDRSMIESPTLLSSLSELSTETLLDAIVQVVSVWNEKVNGHVYARVWDGTQIPKEVDDYPLTVNYLVDNVEMVIAPVPNMAKVSANLTIDLQVKEWKNDTEKIECGSYVRVRGAKLDRTAMDSDQNIHRMLSLRCDTVELIDRCLTRQESNVFVAMSTRVMSVVVAMMHADGVPTVVGGAASADGVATNENRRSPKTKRGQGRASSAGEDRSKRLKIENSSDEIDNEGAGPISSSNHNDARTRSVIKLESDSSDDDDDAGDTITWTSELFRRAAHMDGTRARPIVLKSRVGTVRPDPVSSDPSVNRKRAERFREALDKNKKPAPLSWYSWLRKCKKSNTLLSSSDPCLCCDSDSNLALYFYFTLTNSADERLHLLINQSVVSRGANTDFGTYKVERRSKLMAKIDEFNKSTIAIHSISPMRFEKHWMFVADARCNATLT